MIISTFNILLILQGIATTVFCFNYVFEKLYNHVIYMIYMYVNVNNVGSIFYASFNRTLILNLCIYTNSYLCVCMNIFWIKNLS